MNLSKSEMSALVSQFMAFVNTAEPPATKATPKRKPASKAKSKPVEKPVEAVKPASKGKGKAKQQEPRESFEGNGATVEIGNGSRSKSGHVYCPLFVGDKYVGSLRVSDKAAIRALAKVLRSEAAKDVVAHCDLQADA